MNSIPTHTTTDLRVTNPFSPVGVLIFAGSLGCFRSLSLFTSLIFLSFFSDVCLIAYVHGYFHLLFNVILYSYSAFSPFPQVPSFLFPLLSLFIGHSFLHCHFNVYALSFAHPSSISLSHSFYPPHISYIIFFPHFGRIPC